MIEIFLMIIDNDEDRELISELYIQHKQTLFKIANKYLDDKSFAEDCINATFLNIAKYYDSFKNIPKEKQRAYLSSSCKHAAEKINRESAKAIQFDDEIENNSTINLNYNFSFDDAIILKDAINLLNPKYREPLIMKYAYGYTTNEISNILEINNNLVSQRIFRAKKILFNELWRTKNEI